MKEALLIALAVSALCWLLKLRADRRIRREAEAKHKFFESVAKAQEALDEKEERRNARRKG
jgi:hypothetical protein